MEVTKRQNEIFRTHNNGELAQQVLSEDSSVPVTLCGWVEKHRDLGKLIFFRLRDRWGSVQVRVDETENASAFEVAKKLRSEYVIAVKGFLKLRPPKERKDEVAGDRELHANEIYLYATAKTPPFYVADDPQVDENLRMKFRYLDLRRAPMIRNLTIRHKAFLALRNFLSQEGFLEIETPMLTKSTPEGARDYLVPSRIHKGKFYALPQSPQLLKQILMIAGVDRYFQLVKCFRDEDLRADRQPEFTQLDLEMSFATRQELFDLMERAMAHIFEVAINEEVNLPFQQFTYEEAMKRFGADKPDLRLGAEIVDFTDALNQTEFMVIRSLISSGGKVLGICAPCKVSRKEEEELNSFVKELGAGGLILISINETGELSGSFTKHLSPEERFEVRRLVIASLTTDSTEDVLEAPAGTIFLIAGDENKLRGILAQLRRYIWEKYSLPVKKGWHFAWITDFPLFEIDETSDKLSPSHHPFTHPLPAHEYYLESEPLKVLADCYDLVLNGEELGSGSLRIFNPDLQRRVLRVLGYKDETIDERFGFLLNAYTYGAPPHRGIALGMDRIVMLMCGESNIREVIAFPKTAQATCLLTGAPSEVDTAQLEELGLSTIEGGL